MIFTELVLLPCEFNSIREIQETVVKKKIFAENSNLKLYIMTYAVIVCVIFLFPKTKEEASDAELYDRVFQTTN
jgi:hypothetical protein